MQNICSEITDWLLHASIGECYELTEYKNLKDFIIHNELRNRFDSIWTHQEDSIVIFTVIICYFFDIETIQILFQIIIEKITKEKRNVLEKSDIKNENEIKRLFLLINIVNKQIY